jgi:hypothetical protein
VATARRYSADAPRPRYLRLRASRINLVALLVALHQAKGSRLAPAPRERAQHRKRHRLHRNPPPRRDRAAVPRLTKALPLNSPGRKPRPVPQAPDPRYRARAILQRAHSPNRLASSSLSWFCRPLPAGEFASIWILLCRYLAVVWNPPVSQCDRTCGGYRGPLGLFVLEL